MLFWAKRERVFNMIDIVDFLYTYGDYNSRYKMQYLEITNTENDNYCAARFAIRLDDMTDKEILNIDFYTSINQTPYLNGLQFTIPMTFTEYLIQNIDMYILVSYTYGKLKCPIIHVKNCIIDQSNYKFLKTVNCIIREQND